MSGSLQIAVSPTRAPFDAPVAIHIVGAEPGELVTVRAEMVDQLGRHWSSHAEFTADERGVIDLVQDAPVSGTYDGVEPMGLFWSLGTTEPHILLSPTGQLSVTLRAEAGPGMVSTTTIERILVPDGVRLRDVEEEGVVGRMFLPSGAGPFPAVITLAGSAGGLFEDPAALLAGHGFATLALAYFNFGPLPRELVNIPLEYFESALAWLAAQPGVRGDAIAVMGASRGGELALLLGATFPQIRAVVGIVPSHVVWNGVTRQPRAVPPPSWSYRGSSLPFVTRAAPTPTFGCSVSTDQPIAWTPFILEALRDDTISARAAIPVEKINGPVMLVSAKDDQVWPSTLMANQAIARLERHRHPFPVQHLAYDGAGHVIPPPYRPTTATQSRHPVTDVVFAFGGTPQATALAQADSWPRIVRFLSDSLGPPPARAIWTGTSTLPVVTSASTST